MKKRITGTKPKVDGPRIHLEDPDGGTRHETALPPAPKKTDRDDPEDVKERQAAFDSVFEWKGKVLALYSIGRESAFSQLRVSMGAPPLWKCFDAGDAAVFLPDALRILFLCLHPPEVWMLLRADAVAFQMAIDAWADEQMTMADRQAAVTLALRVHNAAHRNVHEPAPAGHSHGQDLGNSHSPSGSPNT